MISCIPKEFSVAHHHRHFYQGKNIFTTITVPTASHAPQRQGGRHQLSPPKTPLSHFYLLILAFLWCPYPLKRGLILLLFTFFFMSEQSKKIIFKHTCMYTCSAQIKLKGLGTDRQQTGEDTVTSSLYCVGNAKEFLCNLKSPKELYSEGKQRQRESVYVWGGAGGSRDR